MMTASMYPARLALALLACASAGCAVGPVQQAPAAPVPARFEAPLPAASSSAVHDGWWAQFDDPLVATLVRAADADSPTLQQAAARVLQARAIFQREGASRLPQLALNAGATRARAVSAPGVSTIATATDASLDASWEIDLFGARAKATQAADARVGARQADWQGARVALAAEVAATLIDYRACTVGVAILEQDLTSRQSVAHLTSEAGKTGYMARAEGLLSEASVASAREQLVAQRALCDLDVKALVDLTGLLEPSLRASLGKGTGELPAPRAFVVDTVPAQALAQRPDIAAAGRDLFAAAADVNLAEAARYPGLSLGGSIGTGRLRAGGVSGSAPTWSFGPLALSLPLFDGGARKAVVLEAQGRYDELAGAYRQRVRGAVREIEEALVRLDAAARRDADAALAARQYQAYFDAGNEKFRAGASGLLDLEETRRASLAARLTAIGVKRERVQAWIALYKALGGGWHAGAPTASTASSASS